MTRLTPYLIVLAFVLPCKGLSQNQSEHIAIGLLLPDYSQTDVIKAAEFAIEQANAAGGYMNQEFRLVIRSAEGTWGTGSKESVSLVYDDNVRAIVGSLDGRNGHLTEQVASKSHLSYIEAFATEASLSQAFVPWFMRVVPNDNQQSITILDQIRKEGGGSIGILSTEDYDTRYAVRSLTKVVARETNNPPLLIEVNHTNFNQSWLIEKILSSELDHLVIPFDAPFLRDLIISLREFKPTIKIYGTLHFTMGIERRKSAWDAYEGVYLIRPHYDRNKYPALSVSRSAYMYDAIYLVVHAIRQVGTDRASIKDYISESNYSTAVTGSISFDELGNRQGASTLIHIKNGRPVLLNHP